MRDAPLHTNRERALSFGAVADAYDRSRPTYPAALLDDLLVDGPTSALDVGTGTGILGRLLAARGVAVLGIEPDEAMAAVARRHGMTVEIASFEAWDARGRTFPLLTSAQAWHWVDPRLGAAKAAEVVAPLGMVALIWNHSVMPAGLRSELDAVYATYEDVVPVIPHTAAWTREDSAESLLTGTGAFGATDHRTYHWSRTYTTDMWIEQLETHSDHRRLDERARRALLDGVRRVLDANGGSFEMDYDCHASFLRHVA